MTSFAHFQDQTHWASVLAFRLLASRDAPRQKWGACERAVRTVLASIWAGAYTLREGNPLAAQLLLIHPAAFLAAGGAWLAQVAGLVTVLPRPAALTLSVAVSQAHA
jgi:hypothetical protein